MVDTITSEPFLDEDSLGPFFKHNWNDGDVELDPYDETAHTFSHFTYAASSHREVVLDVQGPFNSEDSTCRMFTDPQIVTSEEYLNGKADLGMYGISGFLENHRCTALCHKLLPQFEWIAHRDCDDE